MTGRPLFLSGVWNIKAVYGDWYARIYDRFVATAVSEIGQHEVEEIVLAMLTAGAKVLDVGCGGAHRIGAMALSRPDLSFVGIDNSPRQLKAARRRIRRQKSENIELALGDAERMPFPEGCFDAVLIMGSLKHWPDIPSGLRECWRVLKEGGRVLAMDSNRDAALPECDGLVMRMQFPALTRPVARWHLRRYIILQSLGLADAHRYWSDLTLEDRVGPRLLPQDAAWMMHGRKPFQSTR